MIYFSTCFNVIALFQKENSNSNLQSDFRSKTQLPKNSANSENPPLANFGLAVRFRTSAGPAYMIQK